MMNASSTTLLAALTGVALVTLVGAAHAAGPVAHSPEVASLHADCAASYSYNYSYSGSPQAKVDDNEYRFVYAQGKYKGEATGGKPLPCTEGQYAAYLDTKADPTRVISAYPTAAGRPTVKPGK